MKLLLDTAVLGQLCHPRKHAEVREWLWDAIAVHEPLVPEVADYELRRELLRIRAGWSIRRLDELGRMLGYVPVSTPHWRLAAELWARQRARGRPAASTAALDADMLLAAQALSHDATVVTANPRHFAELVEAMTWREVPSR
ncbi:MAG: PIN domain-containing protein [Deltaproteobacteria bacterium]|nr:PIN domain-containing protein [Deltaproteobacteria bacterium]